MPEPFDHSWPADMVMPVLMPVGMAWAGRARLRVAHDAQNARRTGLQHLDNNRPDAVAKGSQNPIALELPRTSRRVNPMRPGSRGLPQRIQPTSLPSRTGKPSTT